MAIITMGIMTDTPIVSHTLEVGLCQMPEVGWFGDKPFAWACQEHGVVYTTDTETAWLIALLQGSAARHTKGAAA